MKSPTAMILAGEASGDILAGELATALQSEWKRGKSNGPGPAGPNQDRRPIRFIGAGGVHMEQAGVELAFEMSSRSSIGLWEALKQYRHYHQRFQLLLRWAIREQPQVIIGVDFSGFNRRFAGAVARLVKSRRRSFHNWNPRLVQYVSPQVWASRPGRARSMAQTHDLVLSIFPFEPDWYAQHAPSLQVQFVGHPMMDRYPPLPPRDAIRTRTKPQAPFLVLLPGSRQAEIARHFPVMIQALRLMRQIQPDIHARVVLPNRDLAEQVLELNSRLTPGRHLVPLLTEPPPAPPKTNPGASSDPSASGHEPVEVWVGQLAPSLKKADLAIASTGTVTMECAYFQVPTVTMYKTSWSTYQIGRRIIQVQHLAMPNILAGETLYPELIQNMATPENITRESLALLQTPARRSLLQDKLHRVIQSLGPPGASTRAARAILKLL